MGELLVFRQDSNGSNGGAQGFKKTNPKPVCHSARLSQKAGKLCPGYTLHLLNRRMLSQQGAIDICCGILHTQGIHRYLITGRSAVART